MATLIALVIKIVLFIATLKKFWDYLKKTSLVNMLLFIGAAHKAGRKIENGSSKRSGNVNGKADNDGGDRIRDGKPS